MATVTFKEVPRITATNLHEHNRAKFPNCSDSFQLRIRGGRWVTGFDEYSKHLNKLPAEVKEQEFEKLKAKREKFEKLLGVEDLSATSNYWENYLITFETERPLDLTNPIDEMKFEIIKANKFAMDNTEQMYDPEYSDANYLIILENEEVTEKINKTRKFNKAVRELEDLHDNNPDKLRTIAMYLDLPVKENTPATNVYDFVNTFLQNDGFERFLAAASASKEEITAKILFRKALKYKVIRQHGGLYQRGNITLGTSQEKTIDYLMDPENAGEVTSIMDEIDHKMGYA